MKRIGRIILLMVVIWAIPFWVIVNALERGTSIKKELKDLPGDLKYFILEK